MGSYWIRDQTHVSCMGWGVDFFFFFFNQWATRESVNHSVTSDSLRAYELYSLTDCFAHGMSQARILEWLAISFSRKKERKSSHSVMSDSFQHHGPWPARLLRPWDFPGKNTGVGCHFLLQGSSPSGDQTRVSCIAGGFFPICTTREAPYCI